MKYAQKQLDEGKAIACQLAGVILLRAGYSNASIELNMMWLQWQPANTATVFPIRGSHGSCSALFFQSTDAYIMISK